MEWWQQVLDTALLGTDKRQLGAGVFPDELERAVTAINGTDKEEQFLQAASIAFNYRQCGVVPQKREAASIEKAPEEERPYCSPAQLQALKEMLDEDSSSLLGLWLELCAANRLLAKPDLLPELLSEAERNKKWQPLVAAVAGKRGEWLRQFNPAWNFSQTGSEEELWQTGSPEQRKAVLKQQRAVSPFQAREWLQATWAQEDANTKTELLSFLSHNISEDDLPFLESLFTEKSKKVKDMAIRLLKLIPGSEIVQQYIAVLKEAVVLKKEKSLLGIVSKNSLQFTLPEDIDQGIYKTGIEKLSNKKELADELFVIYQLSEAVPPTFWEKQLDTDPAGVLALLHKDDAGKKLLPALASATAHYRDARWAAAFATDNEAFYPGIVPLLPPVQQEAYSLHHFDRFPDAIIDLAEQRTDEWSIPFTKRIFRHTAKQFYQYNRQFYHQQIRRIPAGVAYDLAELAPEEEYQRGAWNNSSAVIRKLILLKTQVTQSFNASK